jgi:hypothetical protein
MGEDNVTSKSPPINVVILLLSLFSSPCFRETEERDKLQNLFTNRAIQQIFSSF